MAALLDSIARLDAWDASSDEGSAREPAPAPVAEPRPATLAHHRWWFAFDRWLVMPDGDDDFVMA
jgi:hypothetical protein